jgi:hypothetical protein
VRRVEQSGAGARLSVPSSDFKSQIPCP